MIIAAIIVGMILAGSFVVWVVSEVLTLKEIRKKADEKLALLKAGRWAIARLTDIAQDPSVDVISMEELNRLADEEGYTHATLLLDENGEVIGDVELVKQEDKNARNSPEVDKYFSSGKPLIIEK